MGPRPLDYIETVLTYEGNYYAPDFRSQLKDFKHKLQSLLISTIGKPELIVKKVEPWNSVRVTFNIPIEAARRLQELAERRDPTLRELGILAVQIEGDRIISLIVESNEAGATAELVLGGGSQGVARNSAPQPNRSRRTSCADAVATTTSGIICGENHQQQQQTFVKPRSSIASRGGEGRRASKDVNDHASSRECATAEHFATPDWLPREQPVAQQNHVTAEQLSQQWMTQQESLMSEQFAGGERFAERFVVERLQAQGAGMLPEENLLGLQNVLPYGSFMTSSQLDLMSAASVALSSSLGNQSGLDISQTSLSAAHQKLATRGSKKNKRSNRGRSDQRVCDSIDQSVLQSWRGVDSMSSEQLDFNSVSDERLEYLVGNALSEFQGIRSSVDFQQELLRMSEAEIPGGGGVAWSNSSASSPAVPVTSVAGQQNIASSSPLLVNLLQSPGAARQAAQLQHQMQQQLQPHQLQQLHTSQQQLQQQLQSHQLQQLHASQQQQLQHQLQSQQLQQLQALPQQQLQLHTSLQQQLQSPQLQQMHTSQQQQQLQQQFQLSQHQLNQMLQEQQQQQILQPEQLKQQLDQLQQLQRLQGAKSGGLNLDSVAAVASVLGSTSGQAGATSMLLPSPTKKQNRASRGKRKNNSIDGISHLIETTDTNAFEQLLLGGSGQTPCKQRKIINPYTGEIETVEDAEQDPGDMLRGSNVNNYSSASMGFPLPGGISSSVRTVVVGNPLFASSSVGPRFRPPQLCSIPNRADSSIALRMLSPPVVNTDGFIAPKNKSQQRARRKANAEVALKSGSIGVNIAVDSALSNLPVSNSPAGDVVMTTSVVSSGNSSFDSSTSLATRGASDSVCTTTTNNNNKYNDVSVKVSRNASLDEALVSDSLRLSAADAMDKRGLVLSGADGVLLGGASRSLMKEFPGMTFTTSNSATSGDVCGTSVLLAAHPKSSVVGAGLSSQCSVSMPTIGGFPSTSTSTTQNEKLEESRLSEAVVTLWNHGQNGRVALPLSSLVYDAMKESKLDDKTGFTSSTFSTTQLLKTVDGIPVLSQSGLVAFSATAHSGASKVYNMAAPDLANVARSFVNSEPGMDVGEAKPCVELPQTLSGKSELQGSDVLARFVKSEETALIDSADVAERLLDERLSAALQDVQALIESSSVRDPRHDGTSLSLQREVGGDIRPVLRLVDPRLTVRDIHHRRVLREEMLPVRSRIPLTVAQLLEQAEAASAAAVKLEMPDGLDARRSPASSAGSLLVDSPVFPVAFTPKAQPATFAAGLVKPEGNVPPVGVDRVAAPVDSSSVLMPSGVVTQKLSGSTPAMPFTSANSLSSLSTDFVYGSLPLSVYGSLPLSGALSSSPSKPLPTCVTPSLADATSFTSKFHSSAQSSSPRSVPFPVGDSPTGSGAFPARSLLSGGKGIGSPKSPATRHVYSGVIGDLGEAPPPVPMTSPAYPLNLTESVQKVMSGGVDLDASPPTSPMLIDQRVTVGSPRCTPLKIYNLAAPRTREESSVSTEADASQLESSGPSKSSQASSSMSCSRSNHLEAADCMQGGMSDTCQLSQLGTETSDTATLDVCSTNRLVTLGFDLCESTSADLIVNADPPKSLMAPGDSETDTAAVLPVAMPVSDKSLNHTGSGLADVSTLDGLPVPGGVQDNERHEMFVEPTSYSADHSYSLSRSTSDSQSVQTVENGVETLGPGLDARGESLDATREGPDRVGDGGEGEKVGVEPVRKGLEVASEGFDAAREGCDDSRAVGCAQNGEALPHGSPDVREKSSSVVTETSEMKGHSVDVASCSIGNVQHSSLTSSSDSATRDVSAAVQNLACVTDNCATRSASDSAMNDSSLTDNGLGSNVTLDPETELRETTFVHDRAGHADDVSNEHSLRVLVTSISGATSNSDLGSSDQRESRSGGNVCMLNAARTSNDEASTECENNTRDVSINCNRSYNTGVQQSSQASLHAADKTMHAQSVNTSVTCGNHCIGEQQLRSIGDSCSAADSNCRDTTVTDDVNFNLPVSIASTTVCSSCPVSESVSVVQDLVVSTGPTSSCVVENATSCSAAKSPCPGSVPSTRVDDEQQDCVASLISAFDARSISRRRTRSEAETCSNQSSDEGLTTSRTESGIGTDSKLSAVDESEMSDKSGRMMTRSRGKGRPGPDTGSVMNGSITTVAMETTTQKTRDSRVGQIEGTKSSRRAGDSAEESAGNNSRRSTRGHPDVLPGVGVTSASLRRNPSTSLKAAQPRVNCSSADGLTVDGSTGIQHSQSAALPCTRSSKRRAGGSAGLSRGRRESGGGTSDDAESIGDKLDIS